MMLTSRKASSALVMYVGIVASILCSMTKNTHALAETGKSTVQAATQVRREHSLDHWDSDTLAYYLDNYSGYDAAIMFYANWDTNSHQLAPYWNDIAVKMDAGTTQSKLIMALFDCELNTAHSQLCAAAGITHYPTMMFIGSGTFYDTDPISKILWGKKSAGIMGESPIPNTVKFQGNWQFIDAINDWIKTMQALSRWHVWTTEGFGKRLRTFFMPQRKSNEELPVGVPGGSSLSGGSSSSTSGTAASKGAGSTSGKSDATVAFLENQVDKYKKDTDEMTKVATRAATMMEKMLFGDDSTDMFTFLDERDAWKNAESYTDLDDIYRACVMETSLDYCQRLAEPMGTKVVDKLLAANLSQDELLAASENIDTLIMDEIAKKEPYCAILDVCIANNMQDESCRPKTCPFTNELACRLLTNCEDRNVVIEYAEALKLDVDTLLPPEGAAI